MSLGLFRTESPVTSLCIPLALCLFFFHHRMKESCVPITNHEPIHLSFLLPKDSLAIQGHVKIIHNNLVLSKQGRNNKIGRTSNKVMDISQLFLVSSHSRVNIPKIIVVPGFKNHLQSLPLSLENQHRATRSRTNPRFLDQRK